MLHCSVGLLIPLTSSTLLPVVVVTAALLPIGVASSTSPPSGQASTVVSVNSSPPCVVNATGNQTPCAGVESFRRDLSQHWPAFLLAFLGETISLITVFGNLVVLLAFGLEKEIRKPNNYFLASLAVSDLLTGVICMPLFLQYILLDEWLLGDAMCNLWLVTTYGFGLVARTNILVITLDRFFLLHKPFEYKAWRTPDKVLVMIGVTWLCPLSVTSASNLTLNYYVHNDHQHKTFFDGDCEPKYLHHKWGALVYTLVTFWIPLVAMVVLYIFIYRVAHQHQAAAVARSKTAITPAFSTHASSSGSHVVTPNTFWSGLMFWRSPQTPHESERHDASMHIIPEEDNADKDNIVRSWLMQLFRRTSGNDSTSGPGDGSTNGRTRSVKDGDCDKDEGTTFMKVMRNFFGAGKTEEVADNTDVNSINNFSADDDSDKDKGTTFVTGVKNLFGRGKAEEETNSKRGNSIRSFVVSKNVEDKTAIPPSVIGKKESNVDSIAHTDITRISRLADKSQSGSRQRGKPQPRQHESIAFTTVSSDSHTTSTSVTGRGLMFNFWRRSDCKSNSRSNSTNNNSALLGTSTSVDSPVATSFVWTTVSDPRVPNHAAKASRTITLILATFMLCWTPLHVLVSVIVRCQKCVDVRVYNVAFWLTFMNSTLNPFCYAFTNEMFKNTMIRIVRLDWHRA